MSETLISERRAIEALRAGVPNGDAVRALRSDQSAIIQAFDDRLANAAELDAVGPNGFVISGMFGSGKSHLVEELHQRALANNFVSSKVAISKETPLHLPAKLVHAVVTAMQAKDKPEGLLLDMVMKYRSDKQSSRDFQNWCGSSESGISVMFRSLLELRDAGIEDLGIVDLVLRYFSGDTIPITTLRKPFRELGLYADTEVVLAVDRPWQTIRFLSRFCQVSGFRGWAIFLDEAELISKYGPISRARAYEQLGRWLGLSPAHRVSGTAVVATVINDFTHDVLGSKGDRWHMPELLAQGRRPADIAGAPFAVEAIAAIDGAMYLEPMEPEQIRSAHDVLRGAHARAYDWDAPELDVEFRRHQPMRLYVRRWINEWDLRRLYGRPTVEFGSEDLKVDLGEDDAYDGPDWEGDTL